MLVTRLRVAVERKMLSGPLAGEPKLVLGEEPSTSFCASS